MRALRTWAWCVALIGALAPCVVHAQSTLAPEWLDREHAAWTGQREPQIEDPTRLYRAAGPSEGSLEGALVLCRVEAYEPDHGRWDAFAEPDLRIAVTIGDRRTVVWGSENASVHVFSIPGVHLRRGQRVTMSVVDRDMTFDEHIGTLRGRFEGSLPLAMRATHLEGECRVAPAALVERNLAASLGPAEGAVSAFESARPDLARADLARPSDIEARRRLLAAAGWGGWREQRVRALRARFDAAERAFDGEVRRAVSEAHRGAPRVGQPATIAGGGAVTVHAFACGARARAIVSEATGCIAELAVSSPRDEAPPWLGRVDVVDARGTVHASSAARFLERESETTARVAVLFPDAPSARGAILRAGDARAFLRLD